MSGSAASNLPIQLTLNGVPEAERGLDQLGQKSRQALGAMGTSAAAASSSMGQLRQNVQNAGFQVNDLVVQLQGGQNALVAISQQGSQFLGMFGPAGAIAGVGLSLATVAAGFLSAGNAAEQAKFSAADAFKAMREGAETTKKLLEQLNATFMTTEERSASLARQERRRMVDSFNGQADEAEGKRVQARMELDRLVDQRRRLGTVEDAGDPNAIIGGGLITARVAREAAELDAEIGKLADLEARLRAARDDAIRGLNTARGSAIAGLGDFSIPRDPNGLQALQASLDDKFRLEQEYQSRLEQIRASSVNGLITEARATELSTAALKKRDEELDKLSRSEASRARSDASLASREQAARDRELLGDMPAIIGDINQAFDRYQEQQNNIFKTTQTTIEANAEQIGLLDSEAGLLDRNADARGRELAIIKERRRIIAAGITDEEQIAKLLEQTGELYDRQLNLAQRKSSFDELAQVGERAFDRIGSAITEAFVQGKGSAIDFGNVSKAVLSEIAQAAARMAIVNPVLNSVFGGTRGTASGLAGSTALSGAGGGAVAGAGSTGGMLDSLSGVGRLFRGGGGTINTGFSWLDSNLNATAYSVGGSNVSVAGAGAGALGVAGGLYGLYSGFQTGGAKGWAQGIGGTASTIAGISTLAGFGASAGLGGAAAGGALAGTAASAGALGVGAGTSAAAGAFGTGAASAFGAGSGAAAAGAAGAGSAILGAVAAVAPYIAVIAAVAALFLPGQKPSDMTGVYLGNLASGETSVGGLGGDRYSQENRDQATQIGQQIATLGDSLKAALGVDTLPFNYSVSLGARDGLVAGYNNTSKYYDADEAGSQRMIADITTAMIDSMKGLASAEIQSIIGASGGNTETLLGNLDWYNGTYKPMIAESENPITQWQQSIDALTTPINAAISKARELGLSEDKLNEVRTRGLQALADQRTATLDALAANDRARQATAAGVSTLTQQIQAWSAAAQGEITALNEQLVQLGLDQSQRDPWLSERWRTLDAEQGALVRQRDQQSAANSNSLWDRFQSASGGSSTFEGARWDYERKALTEWMAAAADGMTDMTMLQKVQNEERLAIERNFAEQAAAVDRQQRDTAAQNVVSTLGGITEFVRQMQLGDSSVLSPQAKLGLASQQFEDLARRAQAGDYDAVSQFTGSAGSLLTAGRDYYASSGGYADLQQRILAVAEGIGNMSPETLTNSSMESIMRDSTDNLGTRIVDAIAELRTENQLLRLELRGMADTR
jgi:hypothetical protein